MKPPTTVVEINNRSLCGGDHVVMNGPNVSGYALFYLGADKGPSILMGKRTAALAVSLSSNNIIQALRHIQF